jgi:hypothetical protein
MKPIYCLRRILSLLIIVFGIIACDKQSAENQNKQIVYFEYYSLNYAWGFQYTHWIIDNKGNVRMNHNPDSIFWINANEIDSCINYFDSIVYKIEPSAFKKYVSLIQPASQGEYDCRYYEMTDVAETGFYCFRDHTFIVLQLTDGTSDCLNTDTSAIKIESWLRSIHVNK